MGGNLTCRDASQPVSGSGMPSLVENSASLCVESPSDTTDRANNASVRYASVTAQRFTPRGMAYRWYARVTTLAGKPDSGIFSGFATAWCGPRSTTSPMSWCLYSWLLPCPRLGATFFATFLPWGVATCLGGAVV